MQKMGSDSMVGEGGKTRGKAMERNTKKNKTVQICKQRLWNLLMSSVNQVLYNHGWTEVKETLNMCHTNVVVKTNHVDVLYSKEN